jgi:predicted DCC family thiol-disulfide oxidoreductase YuxK
MLTVYYNTKCPVCDAGISSQRGRLLDLVRRGVVEFREINLEPEALVAFGVSAEDVRKWLHAVDEGRLISRADVAIALWRLTPGQGWLALLLGNPVSLPMTRLGYNLLAEVLYRWNKRRGHW